ncbi:DUF1206 domain-containing protein [Streptomyces sp. AC495_CC817]|uniref:DUF1206 domain-containing protein n=1 Tax=Streptomyces sp. AC495_CC817 TaxID=2823900 RepID=UPI001C273DEE|nr:DUF1206 domain-containing protein [Streptomyces sp. AC495_CC817]
MSTVKNAARTARRSTVFRRTARAGFVVLGVMHMIIGAVAIAIAAGAGGDADQDGAMEQVRSTPVGGMLLLAIAAGLLALAVWQIAGSSLLSAPDATKKWGRRAKGIGISLSYLVIAAMALVYALGGRADSEDAQQTLSARILQAPGGMLLLVLVGLCVGAVGCGFVVGAFTRAFEKTMDIPDGALGAGIRALGIAGYLAKGVAVVATGGLFVAAAVTQDPQKAAGLDGALRSLVALPWGRAILWAVAAGLIVYGVFCLARARYTRMESAV